MDAPWRIELLGWLRASQGDCVVRRFRRQKTGMLLAYLAYHCQRSHPREALIELLWPECPREVGRNRLRVALTSLRRQLEPPGVPPGAVLLADAASLQLSPAACTTDVAEFEAAVAAARADSGTGRMQRLLEAAEQYRGELLPGSCDEWVLLEQAGDLPLALQWARRAVAADPLREEAHHDLIRLLAAAGQSEAAVRQYQELRRLFAQKLGDTPAPEIGEFVRAIQRRAEERQHTASTRFAGTRTPRTAHRIPDAVRGERCAVCRALPQGALTGTVTFLLTEARRTGTPTDPPAAPMALLDRLRSVIRQRGGREVSRPGAVLTAAFGRATDALTAAIALLREAASHPVRMALHTGEVDSGQEFRQSPALSHSLRLLSAAYPGQLLVSEKTAVLLRDELPEGLRLIDLGLYHLRQGAPPEHLFQVHHLEVSGGGFPPPNAAPAHAGNLPLQWTRFFGRERELADLSELLLTPETRLVTLTGPGGSGKTRLALEVAARLHHGKGTAASPTLYSSSRPLAAWFVPLMDLADPGFPPRHRSERWDLLPDKVVDALRLPRSSGVEPLEQVVAFLSRQPSLLLLDNFEHLLPEGGPFVPALLERVEALTLLVTSRQRLGLAGEREFPVSPLPVPGVQAFRRSGVQEGVSLAPEPLSAQDRVPAQWVDFAGYPPKEGWMPPERLNALAQCASVALFVDRAQAVRADFQVTRANVAVVAGLCARLEGIPLAIELAAARSGVLTPAQMLARLSQRFDWLVSRAREPDPRHRSLRATLDWSYQLLSPELQRFFARLSVFRGGFTLEAVEAVWGGEGVQAFRHSGVQEGQPERLNAPLDYLEQLRECSLVLAEEPGVRVPAQRVDSGLENRDEESPPRTPDPGRLNTEFRFRLLETLREYGAEQLSPEERAALARRHAQFFLGLAEEAEPRLRGPEQGEWLDRLESEVDNLRAALAWSEEHDSGEIGLRLAGHLFWFWDLRGYISEGRRWLERALQRASPAARTAARAKALYGTGALALWQGDHATARALQEESVAIWREVGDRRGLANSLRNLGMVNLRQGDPVTARSLLTESLAIWRELSDRFGIGMGLNCLGAVASSQGDYAAARALHEQGLAVIRDSGDPWGLAWSLLNLGDVARWQSDYEQAGRLYHECMVVSHEIRASRSAVYALEGLAAVLTEQGQPERAARLLGASQSIRDTMGLPLIPAVRAEHARHVAALRASLGEDRFAAAWAEGRSLGLEEAMEAERWTGAGSPGLGGVG
jgi:predicted ATPase/DNA-binding SARP family transcriptional activator